MFPKQRAVGSSPIARSSPVDTVLARLEYRFSADPIDWSDPYWPPSVTPPGE